jgi:hypothetical protein
MLRVRFWLLTGDGSQNSFMEEITKETTLKEVLKKPGAEKILGKYNFPCLGCFFAQYEADSLKLGQVCKMYDIDAEKLIKDLNKKK